MFNEKELSLKEAILLIRRIQSSLSYNEQQEVIALANKYQRHDYMQRRIKRCRGKIAKLQTELDDCSYVDEAQEDYETMEPEEFLEKYL